MKNTFEFTEKERDQCYENLVSYNTNQIKSKELIDRIEQIVSERITPEPVAKSRERIVLERLLEKIKDAQSHGANYAIENEDVVAIALVLSINSQSAPITPEPGESGQSAEEILNDVTFDFTLGDPQTDAQSKLVYYADALQSMTTYASQVCADKETKISALIHQIEYFDGIESKLYASNQVCADKDEKIKFWVDGWNHLSRMYDQSQSELSAANESMTVMLRKNAELEEWYSNLRNQFELRVKAEQSNSVRPEVVVPSDKEYHRFGDRVDDMSVQVWNECIEEIKRLNPTITFTNIPL